MITLGVDGFGTESGAFVLRINCPQLGHDDPSDLGSAAFTVAHRNRVAGADQLIK